MTNFLETLRKIFIDESYKMTLIGKVLISILIAIVALILVALIDKYIYKKLIKDKDNFSKNTRIMTAATVANSFVKVFVYSLAVLAILDFMGANTKSIIAVAGVGGITVAFAAQSIVKDVINGAFLLFENQFDIGDWIEVKGRSGTVVDMNLKTLKLQDFGGQIHMIPNGQIDMVTNHSKNPMKAVADISLSNMVPIEESFEVIRASIKDLKSQYRIFLSEPVILGIIRSDEFSYTIRIIAMTGPGSQWEGERIIRKNVISALQDQGLIKDIGRETKKVKNGKI